MIKALRHRAIPFAFAVLFLFSLIGCVLLSFPCLPKRPMPILMYHNIVPDDQDVSGMTVSQSHFRQDMQYLIDHNYSFVLPRELAAGQIPEKPVMVTFDDGYSSTCKYLLPILKEMNVKVALALVVSMPEVRRSDDFLSWEMCREMSDSGLVEFGSHTFDLHNFDGRGGSFTKNQPNGIQRKKGESQSDYETRVCGDLQKSIDLIEQHLGTDVCYFAFPYGVTDIWADSFIRSRFAVTVTTRSAVADLDNGLYNMTRLTVSNETLLDEELKAYNP